jgi:hypothetical protein
LWTPWNALLPSVDTFAADGTQSVQCDIFGVPFLGYSYTSSSQLAEVVLGPDLLIWGYSGSGVLSMIRLNGMQLWGSASAP